jgi:hypothetical protein
MTPLRLLIGLGSLALGIGATWWFYSGATTGEFGQFIYAGPLIVVGFLPAGLGFLAFIVVLSSGNPSPGDRTTSLGSLGQLRARTSTGYFIAAMISGAISVLILILCVAGIAFSSNSRDAFFYACCAVLPFGFWLLACKFFLSMGKKEEFLVTRDGSPAPGSPGNSDS